MAPAKALASGNCSATAATAATTITFDPMGSFPEFIKQQQSMAEHFYQVQVDKFREALMQQRDEHIYSVVRAIKKKIAMCRPANLKIANLKRCIKEVEKDRDKWKGIVQEMQAQLCAQCGSSIPVDIDDAASCSNKTGKGAEKRVRAVCSQE